MGHKNADYFWMDHKYVDCICQPLLECKLGRLQKFKAWINLNLANRLYVFIRAAYVSINTPHRHTNFTIFFKAFTKLKECLKPNMSTWGAYFIRRKAVIQISCVYTRCWGFFPKHLQPLTMS